MTVEQLLNEEFNSLKADLIAAYDAKGMRSSGKWADELKTEVGKNNRGGYTAKLTGLNYSQQLETGRRPGKQPPSEAIERWINEKGIANRLQGKISVSSLAYLIARKIAREGWKRQNEGGVELISEVVTPQRIQSIIDKVCNVYKITVTTEIVKALNTLSV